MCKIVSTHVFFDGSVSSHGALGGWILYTTADVMTDDTIEWAKIPAMRFPLGRNARVKVVEIEASLAQIPRPSLTHEECPHEMGHSARPLRSSFYT